MNAVEIEEAVSKLVDAPFDPAAFPFAFLEAFGNKEATVKRLKAGASNQSDVPGAVLQRNNIHIKTCPEGQVSATLAALRTSLATTKQKAKFILATDGKELHAESLTDDVPPLACEYRQLPDHFGFFLPLAGITTVRQISENAFDIRATGRLNRLYVELRRHNPDWDNRREDLNHFFARLIFCFFAEDTGIFDGPPSWGSNPHYGLFSWAVETMTEPSGANVHQVLSEFFRAMNTPRTERGQGGKGADLSATACRFPYVNGKLFSDSTETPRFSKSARNYLLFIGGLDWKLINPDIFGSMIQAVAEDEERGALGMHYTSVPNILKVLNPLFLDDLRQKLAEAGDGSTPASKGQLKRLRDRLSRIRVFDPACGSGNFLVIAYKEMRQIEAVINERRGERDLPSVIPMTNFRGIELRHFAAEIARLALIIAKFQCDVLHISQRFACERLLPLDKQNWIMCGNALRLDWLDLLDARGTGIKLTSDDLYSTPLDQTEIDFENSGGEVYICGNPPYAGTRNQDHSQKQDLEVTLSTRITAWRSLDYVTGWLVKASDVLAFSDGAAAFVTTNSICQGLQVAPLWEQIKTMGTHVPFAHTTFRWSNLASHNAGVSVIIVGLRNGLIAKRMLYTISEDGAAEAREVSNINGYLAPADDVFVEQLSQPMSQLPPLERGCAPVDDGHYFLDDEHARALAVAEPEMQPLMCRAVGGEDFIRGKGRVLIRVRRPDELTDRQRAIVGPIAEKVAAYRSESTKATTRRLAKEPFRFGEEGSKCSGRQVFVPNLHSERRPYLTAGVLQVGNVVLAPNFGMDFIELYPLAIISTRLHLVWIATVCGKLETRYRYSNTLGWNTFPVPLLSDQNRADLTRCAEDILLAREAHFPATIADLYDPEAMPADLKAAHDRNDETLERIYIGRRFKNDTERLEVLFDLYTKMVAKQPPKKQAPAKEPRKAGKK